MARKTKHHGGRNSRGLPPETDDIAVPSGRLWLNLEVSSRFSVLASQLEPVQAVTAWFDALPETLRLVG